MKTKAVKQSEKKPIKKKSLRKTVKSKTNKKISDKPKNLTPIKQSRPTFPVTFIAHALNIDERRVQQLVKEGIIPKSGRGKYDLLSCSRGYIQYLQKLANSSAAGRPASEINENRARLIKLKADQLEFQIGVEKKKYIPVVDVKTLMIRLITNAKSKLLSIPKRLAPILLPMKTEANIFKEIKSHVDEALQELSEQDKS